MGLFSKTKELHLERAYPASVETVWRAWTEPDRLRAWWCPPKSKVAECEVDLRVGGRIHIVTEATEAMGKHAGTRWPMDGTFTRVEQGARLTYDARSWVDGREDDTTIVHTNDVTFARDGDKTVVRLDVTITDIGPKAKLAAFGMKWGYGSQLKSLDDHLDG